jgi:glycosidase
VPRELGGERGLKKFRQQLNRQGLKLLLDLVPNHVGLDHAWVAEHPEWFVHRDTPGPGTFRQSSPAGELWLAHGKDPNFLAWNDTAQLDYRRPATRAAMIEALKDVARRCDGVRCDMAMLLLNDVFVKTWQDFPPSEPPPATEFWEKAIATVKAGEPDFMFVAEAYWDLEARLQALGFDYVYDKRLYDFLATRDNTAAQHHLASHSPEFVRASAHFLENHDEARIASLLTAAEHRAAALVILSLPGMRLIHDGQLTGARVHTPVQLGRRLAETPQAEVQTLYDQLLDTLAKSAVGRGEGKVLSVHPAWPDNCTCANFVVVQWQAQPPSFDLVAVNLAPQPSQCYAPLEAPDLAKFNWRMQDLLGTERYERYGDDLQNQGLYLDVPAHGAQLFHFDPL